MKQYNITNEVLEYDWLESFLSAAYPDGVVDYLQLANCTVVNLPKGIRPFTYTDVRSVAENDSVNVAIAELHEFFGRELSSTVYIRDNVFKSVEIAA